MKVVVAVCMVVACIFGFLLTRERQALHEAQAQAEELRATTNTLAVQVEELRKTEAAPVEVERLKADQREVIRLRGEVVNLKRQVEEAKAIAAHEEGAAVRARRLQEQNRALGQANGGSGGALAPVFNTQTSATMPPGQTMVVGGWETSPGKKMYALVTPTVTEGGTNSLTIDAKWISIPTDVAEKFASMFPTNQEPVGPDQIAQLIKTLKETGQMDFFNAPRLTTLSGQRGRIMTGTGPEVDFQPTLSPDGTQIQLNVDARAPAGTNAPAK